ncbi:MAG: hypothetical protein ACFE9D_10200 [Promethearchaeota archaeon]
MWFRMGFDDIEYAYERYKLERDIIKPYADDMEMVRRIQGYEAHFFPWRRYLLLLAFSGVVFASVALLIGANLWIFGSPFIGYISDWVPVGFVVLGIIGIILALHLRRKFMVISVDGISVPRVFGSNQTIRWPHITKINFKASGWDEAITLIIEYGSQKRKTHLGWYKNIYLAGARKELRLVRVLQGYYRLRVQGMDLEPIRRQIKIDRTKRYGLHDAVGGLVVALWLLVTRALIFLAGWLIAIPALIMAFPLGLVAFIGVGLYQGKPMNSTVRRYLVVSLLVIVICVVVILVMLLATLL